MASRRNKKPIEEKTEDKINSVPIHETNDLIPSGSTIFNLACSNNAYGAFKKGKIVNLIGDSHAGKCLRQAYILSENGMEKIDNIGNKSPEGLSTYKSTYTTSKGKKDTTSHFWKETVDSYISVKTRHGFELEGTKDHKIKIFNEDNFEFEMKKLSDLNVGDVAVIASNTQTFNNKNQKLPKIHNLDSNAKEANFPEKINAKMARLIGYFVADGNLYKSAVRISNSRKYIRKDIKKIAKSFGLSFTDQGISSVHLARLFMSIFATHENKNLTAKHKFTPEIILQSTKEVQCAFIRALFDCDSWSDGKQLCYYTSSEELGKQIQLMLLNIGILSSRTFKYGAFDGKNYHDHLYWTISIYGSHINTYNNQIGSLKYEFVHKENMGRNEYDIIPSIVYKMKQDIKECRRKVGWSKNGRCDKGTFPKFKFGDTFNGSWNLLDKFINTFKKWPIEIEFYEHLKSSGYHFTKITNITEIDEPVEVYDVHIPKTHLFWGNGFVNHNTILALTTLAMCVYLKRFDNHELIYDDIETADEFDTDYMFGKKFKKRVIAPKYTKEGYPDPSSDIEEWQDRLHERLDKKVPFIYVTDSFDALHSEEDEKKAIEQYEARQKGNKTKGSYGMAKARMASNVFRRLRKRFKETNSLLLVISQTRDNVDPMSHSKKTRSGGKALKFYSTHEIWGAVTKKINKTVNKNSYEIGGDIQWKITKNKLTGRNRTVTFPIYNDIGVDDVASCIDFLEKHGGLEKTSNTYKIPELDLKGTKEKIIRTIEDNDLENKLSKLCEEKWIEIEKSLRLKRKRRFK